MPETTPPRRETPRCQAAGCGRDMVRSNCMCDWVCPAHGPPAPDAAAAMRKALDWCGSSCHESLDRFVGEKAREHLPALLGELERLRAAEASSRRRQQENFHAPMEEVSPLKGGYTLYRRNDEVGGRDYFSDEIGGGVHVWNTSLVSPEMLRAALEAEGGHAAKSKGATQMTATESWAQYTDKNMEPSDAFQLGFADGHEEAIGKQAAELLHLRAEHEKIAEMLADHEGGDLPAKVANVIQIANDVVGDAALLYDMELFPGQVDMVKELRDLRGESRPLREENERLRHDLRIAGKVNEARLAEIRRRHEAATEGPYFVKTTGLGIGQMTFVAFVCYDGTDSIDWSSADYEFLAASWSDIRDLLAEVERLRDPWRRTAGEKPGDGITVFVAGSDGTFWGEACWREDVGDWEMGDSRYSEGQFPWWCPVESLPQPKEKP